MTKRKQISHIRLKKAALWVERTMTITGYDEMQTQQLLTTQRTQSLRVNPLRGAGFAVEAEYSCSPIAWCQYGYRLDDSPARISKSERAQNGEVFIQNAASWLPVLALDPQPGDTILDVCAAPGGKASHIQAITQNQSTLVCNDNSKPRLLKLQANMERLGAHATYSLHDATKLGRYIEPGTFDKILLDAPCSGEGLMTLLPEDAKLFDSWSVAHIRRLSDMQKKILGESWKLLKPGGVLVYSTCTMAPEENETVVDYFLRKHSDAHLQSLPYSCINRIPALTSWNDREYEADLSACLRLVPGDLTEAFFVAKLVKSRSPLDGVE